MSRTAIRLGDALQELIDYRGKTPKKLGGDWSATGHRVVSAINIKNNRVDNNDHHYVSDELYQKWMKVRLQPGDVLLTSEAPTGEVAYIAEPVDWCLGQRLFALRGKPGVLDGRYLYYALKGGPVRQQLMSRTTGTTVAGIRQSELVQVLLDLPPFDQQVEIGAALGAMDEAIDSNGRQIRLAAELLDTYAESLRHLPSVPLGQVAVLNRSIVNPKALGDEEVDHFSLPAFDAGALPERVAASTIMSNKTTFASEAILISRLNPRIERMWWVPARAAAPAMASTEFACLSGSDGVDLAALWLAVRDPYFRDEVPRRVTGTSGSHQRVRPDDLMSIDVPDVSRLSASEVARTRELLDVVSQRREASARLAACRDSLLPDLIEGRIVANAPSCREDIA